MENEQNASGAQVPCISLLACPFCGGPAKIDIMKMWWWSRREYLARCTLCSCLGPGPDWTNTPEETAGAWNTRHANAPHQPEPAAGDRLHADVGQEVDHG